MKVVAVYGSLKMGKYNHPLIKDCKYLGKSKIETTMYLIGSYPAIVDKFGGHTQETHDVELYELDEVTYARVRNMEIGAGYKEVTKKFAYKADYKYNDPDSYVDAIIYYADDDLARYCAENREIISVY